MEQTFLDYISTKFWQIVELVGLLIWLPGFWTTLVGVLIGFAASCLTIWWQNKRQQKIARMQVATNLRHWMNRTLLRHDDTVIWIDSNGHGGMAHHKIPRFRFEDSLEQVFLLDRKTAINIFQLIHKKDNANAEIEAALKFQDETEAANIFRGRSASLFLDAWAIYSRVSRKVRWSEKVFLDDVKVKKKMQSEVARLKEVQKTQAESNAKMFDE